jgi:hypothetical protein
LRVKLLLILVCLFPIAALDGSALGQTIATANKPCHRGYAQYRNNPEHKAFVVNDGQISEAGLRNVLGISIKTGAIEQAFKEYRILRLVTECQRRPVVL